MLKMEFKFKYTMVITKLQTILASFILVNVKKNLRKSQAHFREKLRKLRLKQNYGFLIKKTCNQPIFCRFCDTNSWSETKIDVSVTIFLSLGVRISGGARKFGRSLIDYLTN